MQLNSLLGDLFVAEPSKDYIIILLNHLEVPSYKVLLSSVYWVTLLQLSTQTEFLPDCITALLEQFDVTGC